MRDALLREIVARCKTSRSRAPIERVAKALQNTGLRDFRQSHFVDIAYTPGYTSWFLAERRCHRDVAARSHGGVAQLGERLNGIQEVRGSIPLASIAATMRVVVGRSRIDVCWRCDDVRSMCWSDADLDQCGNSSVGRAQPCQGWGRGFESRFPLCACGSASGSVGTCQRSGG